MIEDIMKVINKAREKKDKKKEAFRKRYWKLPAEERLHYDSIRVRIEEDNHVVLLGITLHLIKIFFYIFFAFAVLKFIFELDLLAMVKILTPIINIIPIVLKVSIFLDIFLILISRVFFEPREIKNLNVRFGLLNKQA